MSNWLPKLGQCLLSGRACFRVSPSVLPSSSWEANGLGMPDKEEEVDVVVACRHLGLGSLGSYYTAFLHPLLLTWSPGLFSSYRLTSRRLQPYRRSVRHSRRVCWKSSNFYSHLFFVEKATGIQRPIITLAPLNRFILQTKVKMKTFSSILSESMYPNNIRR